MVVAVLRGIRCKTRLYLPCELCSPTPPNVSTGPGGLRGMTSVLSVLSCAVQGHGPLLGEVGPHQ